MYAKGVILPDHMPVNRYVLKVTPGLFPSPIIIPDIEFITVSGIEEELQSVDLPDRTTVSGGNTMPVEFTATQCMHHKVEVDKLEAWFRECIIVSPTYKRNGILIHRSLSGVFNKEFTIAGMFITKRKLPDLDLNNEGEIANIEWTFRADELRTAL